MGGGSCLPLEEGGKSRKRLPKGHLWQVEHQVAGTVHGEFCASDEARFIRHSVDAETETWQERFTLTPVSNRERAAFGWTHPAPESAFGSRLPPHRHGVGFAVQVATICSQLRPDRQTCMFSATSPGGGQGILLLRTTAEAEPVLGCVNCVSLNAPPPNAWR